MFQVPPDKRSGSHLVGLVLVAHRDCFAGGRAAKSFGLVNSDEFASFPRLPGSYVLVVTDHNGQAPRSRYSVFSRRHHCRRRCSQLRTETVLGNSGLRVGRKCRIGNGAAQEVKGLLERPVVLFLGRHIGLRARFFGTFGFEMPAQRCLTLGIGARLQIGGHFLEHLYIGLDALRLD